MEDKLLRIEQYLEVVGYIFVVYNNYHFSLSKDGKKFQRNLKKRKILL